MRISLVAPKQCVTFVLDTFGCVLSLCINCNSKQSGNHASQYPTWNSCLVVWPWAMSKNTEVSQVGISKVLRLFREIGRAIQRPLEHQLRMTTPGKDCTLIRIMTRNRFLSSSRIWVELIRRTGRRVPSRMVQRRLVAAGWVSLKTSS